MGGRAHTILEKELPALIDAFGGIEKTPAPIREIPPLIDTSHLTGPSPRILAAAIAIEQKVAAFVESRPRSLPAALDSLIPAEPVGTPYQP